MSSKELKGILEKMLALGREQIRMLEEENLAGVENLLRQKESLQLRMDGFAGEFAGFKPIVSKILETDAEAVRVVKNKKDRTKAELERISHFRTALGGYRKGLMHSPRPSGFRLEV